VAQLVVNVGSARNLSPSNKDGCLGSEEMRTEYQCIVGMLVLRPQRGVARLSLSVGRQT